MTVTDAQLDATFAALADRTRRAIITRLADGPATVKELAEPFPMTLQAVSRHVKVLESANLLSQTIDAQRRPCHLETDVMDELVEWIETLTRRWEDRLDGLGQLLSDLETEGGI